jgi:hypothetical protein
LTWKYNELSVRLESKAVTGHKLRGTTGRRTFERKDLCRFGEITNFNGLVSPGESLLANPVDGQVERQHVTLLRWIVASIHQTRSDSLASYRFFRDRSGPFHEEYEDKLAWKVDHGAVRRLNRVEYQNTLRDLLNLPRLDVMTMLPEDAVAHDTRNLLTLLVGGGFGHAGHLAFDRKDNRPLADLYVSMLQQLGLETDRFASGTTTLPGLEIV